MRVIAEPERVPVKAWVDGVEFEDKAQKQVLNLASMPFVYKHVAVMPDVHSNLQILGELAAAMFVLDVFGALVVACIAAGKDTWAANFDTVGDVTGKYFLPIAAVAADHAGLGLPGAIATAIGGWFGTKLGTVLGKHFAARITRNG